jgi:LuxR family maltose regulon positive regulatory protein
MLDKAPAEALVLITAPPGFGKTVLVADWARHRPRVSWLSLDEDDDAPERFWPAVVAALARGLPATRPDEHLRRVVGRWADRGWHPGDDVELLAELLDAGARSPAPLEIVLDGTEHLQNRRITDGLRVLLRSPQSSVRLVLAGRVVPALPVARLRVEGRLCELDADVLRFTVEECDTLLQEAGLRLDRAHAELLHARTGGWAAGVRLAALRLQEHPDPARFLSGFPTDERAVADFLDTEILVHLSDDERDLLSRVSVADPVPAALAVALSGRTDAADVLDRISHRTGLLTTIGAARAEYQTQALLRSHLSVDLERHGRDGVDVLHERAARWWTDQGHPVEALRHAQLSGAPRLLDELLNRWAVTLAARGDHALLRDSHGPLDACGPWLSSSTAVARLAWGDVAGAADALRPARRGTDDRVAELAAYRTAVERLAGVPHLPGRDERVPDEPALAAMCLLGRGAARLFSDTPAGPDLCAALALARAHDLAFVQAQSQSLLAVADWLQGDLVRCVERATAGIDAAAVGGWGGSPWTAAARAAAAHAQLLHGRPQDALALCTDSPGPAPWPPVVRFVLGIVRGAARFDDGDRKAGLEQIRHARAELGPTPAPRAICVAGALLEHHAALALGHLTAAATALGWLAARAPGTAELTVARARTESAGGRADSARRIVRPVLNGAARPVLPWTVVDAWLVETNGACSVGDRAAARRALRTAVVLAEPWDVVRPFAALDDRATGLLLDV